MIEEHKLYIRFFSGRYDGGEKLLKDLTNIIKTIKTPIDLGLMHVHDGHSMLMIGGSLIYRGENNIRGIFPNIIDIIQRIYENEINDKKKEKKNVGHLLNTGLDKIFEALQIIKREYGETNEIYQELFNIYSHLPDQLQKILDKINIKLDKR
jgi:hypothetical protein